MTLTIVSLIGPPACGKGTLTKSLTQEFNFHAVSTGDLIRARIASGDELGQKLKPVVESGALVEHQDYNRIFMDFLAQQEKDKSGRVIVLDGSPRTMAEADDLLELEKKGVLRLAAVIALDASPDALRARVMKRREGTPSEKRRKDDDPAVFERRLKEYTDKTFPVIKHLQAQGRAAIIDTSNLAIEDTRRVALKVLASYKL